jgi:hypothetical protein
LHRFPFPSHGTVVGWVTVSVICLACGTFLAERLVVEGQSIEAFVALGLTTELVSPISWSHHFVWIVLVPVILVKMSKSRPLVITVLLLLIAVAVLGPYAWITHGWGYRILSDSLVVVTFFALTTWSTSKFLQTISPGRRSNKVTAGHFLAIARRPLEAVQLPISVERVARRSSPVSD